MKYEQITNDCWMISTLDELGVPVIIKAYAKQLVLGDDTFLGPGLKIGMPNKPVERFVAGECCRFFGGTIAPRTFECGDYVTIHDGVWCFGRNPVKMGHNCWFGMRCTLDAEGEFEISNNFGAGQDSHLWSHVRFGDVLQGCKYLSFRKFSADTDVWFVGRCTAAPIHCGAFSVAMVESNVTNDMEGNHVYGGNPAKDLTDKLGAPYELPSLERREELFHWATNKFIDETGSDMTIAYRIAKMFDVRTRTYYKAVEPEEVKVQRAFMRFLLPTNKFTPEG